MKREKVAGSFRLLVLCLALAIFALPTINVQLVGASHATKETFVVSSSDGEIVNASATWSVARNATAGHYKSQTQDSLEIGTDIQFGEYYVWRSFLFFNTSSLIDDVVITSVTLRIKVGFDPWGSNDFNLTVQSGMPVYPHDPLELADFNRTNYSGNGGMLDTTNVEMHTFHDINITELSWINKTGITKFVLRSSNDIEGVYGGRNRMTIKAYEEGASSCATLTVEWQDYYVFRGVYDEDTGLLKATSQRAVNVTAYYIGGVASETFEVNGTYTYYPTVTPQYFYFNLTNPRQYWLGPTEGAIDIYVFDTSTTIYTITFLDLAGALDTYAYVEAKRYINGTLHIVEKRKVDEEKKVVMALKNGEKYTFLIRDGASYTFGDVAMTSDTTVDLTLKGIEFPQNIILAYRYVRVYAERTFGATGTGNITVTYNDTRLQTTKVDIYVRTNDGTLAYNATETSNSFVHIWASADNETDYYAVAEIDHQGFGTLKEGWYFPRGFSDPPWTLDILGTLPFATSVLIPTFIIICVAGVFSALTVPPAAILVTATATILSYLGWIPGGIDVRVLVAAWAFSIILALIWAKRKVAL